MPTGMMADSWVVWPEYVQLLKTECSGSVVRIDWDDGTTEFPLTGEAYQLGDDVTDLATNQEGN